MTPPTTGIMGPAVTQDIRNDPGLTPQSGFIDLHHHILFGVDDGPKSRDESLAMLALAYQEGTRQIIATPHYDPLGSCPDVGMLQAQLAEFNAVCAEKLPGLSIALGSEVFFGEGVRRRLQSGVIPTLAGSDHVLVEFAPAVERDYLEKAVRHLANGGYVTIIAHMERYPVLVKNPEFARFLKEKYGTLLQVNAETFLTRQQLSVKRFLRRAVPEGLIDFVASDAHGTVWRKTRLIEAYKTLSTMFGEAVVRSLFQGRAAGIFGLAEPAVQMPSDIKEGGSV